MKKFNLYVKKNKITKLHFMKSQKFNIVISAKLSISILLSECDELFLYGQYAMSVHYNSVAHNMDKMERKKIQKLFWYLKNKKINFFKGKKMSPKT